MTNIDIPALVAAINKICGDKAHMVDDSTLEINCHVLKVKGNLCDCPAKQVRFRAFTIGGLFRLLREEGILILSESETSKIIFRYNILNNDKRRFNNSKQG